MKYKVGDKMNEQQMNSTSLDIKVGDFISADDYECGKQFEVTSVGDHGRDGYVTVKVTKGKSEWIWSTRITKVIPYKAPDLSNVKAYDFIITKSRQHLMSEGWEAVRKKANSSDPYGFFKDGEQLPFLFDGVKLLVDKVVGGNIYCKFMGSEAVHIPNEAIRSLIIQNKEN